MLKITVPFKRFIFRINIIALPLLETTDAVLSCKVKIMKYLMTNVFAWISSALESAILLS